MIIVTGGAGFIGSNIIYALNKRGINDILVVDNLKNTKKHRNLNRLYFKDFIDKYDFLDTLNDFTNIKVIFHEGACSDTMETDGKYIMHNNYEYSKKLLNFSLKNNIRFIHASSASVYGNGENGFIEGRSCEYPLNAYAFSKFLFDQYIRRMLNNAKTQIVALRYFNVYGQQENHKGRMASVVFKFHNQIKNGQPMQLFEGSEKFLRDFVYIDDAVDVNLFFFDNPNKSGIFNCGTGHAKSFFQIAQVMEKLYDNASVEFIPFPSALEGKYQSFTQANMSKLKKTGYTKTFSSLDDGIAKYVNILKKTNGYII